MKTTQQIQELQLAVQAQLEALPPTDEYGYPTDEEREEMESILKSLATYLQDGSCSDEAVESWLYGNDEYYVAEFYLKGKE